MNLNVSRRVELVDDGTLRMAVIVDVSEADGQKCLVDALSLAEASPPPFPYLIADSSTFLFDSTSGLRVVVYQESDP